MGESILKRYRLSPPGNACAGWSVIAGIAGFCVPFIGGAAAVVLGIIGIVQARRTMNGKGAAATGLCLGLASILIYLLVWMAVSGVVSLFGHHPTAAPAAATPWALSRA